MFGLNSRAARAAWTVFVVAAALGIAYLARETLFILILAIFFAYLLLPAVHVLQRHAPKLPRSASVALVFALVLVVVGTVGMSLGERISAQADALAEKLPALVRDPHLSDRLPLPDWMEPLRTRLAQIAREQVQSSEGQGASFIQRIGMYVVRAAGNLLYVVVIPILGFLLLKDGMHLREGFLDMVPRRQCSLVSRLLDDLNTLLARYIRALLLLSLATFTAYAVVLGLIGVPYSLVIAAVAGPLEFIPVLGPLTAAGIALLVSVFGGYPHVLWIVGFLTAYRIFQDYVLSPYLMSQGIELHPVIVIGGILAGEQIAGIPGMFLAIPLLATAKVIAQRLREVPAKQVTHSA